jgi:hypothetical protein
MRRLEESSMVTASMLRLSRWQKNQMKVEVKQWMERAKGSSLI